MKTSLRYWHSVLREAKRELEAATGAHRPERCHQEAHAGQDRAEAAADRGLSLVRC